MDNTKQFTAIEWCAGYGGIHLGLKRAIPNLRVIAYGEIEAFAVANLVAKMEAGLMDCAPVWSDLKTFPCEAFRDRVDLLVAGYPCQPFSAAGKRLGTEDPRHLWPHIARSIRIIRPRMCFFENVEGHISLGLREVIGELEQMGYKVSWGIFSASEVGAPHQRKRVFILAYRECEGLEGWISGMQSESNGCGTSSDISESSNLLVNSINNVWSDACGVQHGETKQPISSIASGDVAYSVCNGSGEGWLIRQGADGAEPFGDGESRGVIELADACHGSNPEDGYAEAHRLPSKHWQEVCSGFTGGANATAWPSRPGEPQHAWEPPRVVGGSMAYSNSSEQSEERGDDGEVLEVSSEQRADQRSTISGGEGAAMGNADHGRLASGFNAGSSAEEDRGGQGDIEQAESWQTEPSLGRDPDGAAGGLGYAELQVSCDNRTDELRLLGNGVVPATAERAFRILMEEL